MPSRWKDDRPEPLSAFAKRFPDDAACARYLASKRWPVGFECPACHGRRGWELTSKRWTWECAGCGRQTSVTAGTVMHGSKVPLRTWFLAAYLMASHSNGMSALQMQAHLGLGSYKTAWVMCAKLRRAMVDPDRSMLDGVVEVDETSIPFRAASDPTDVDTRGRSHVGKMMIVGAVEVAEGKPRRIRLAPIAAYDRETLAPFLRANVARGTVVKCDGLTSYRNIEGFEVRPRVVGKTPAHEILPWIHRVFSNMKRMAMGVYHGLRRKHLQSYLDEIVFRWNRRRHRAISVERLLEIALGIAPVTYWEIVGVVG